MHSLQKYLRDLHCKLKSFENNIINEITEKNTLNNACIYLHKFYYLLLIAKKISQNVKHKKMLQNYMLNNIFGINMKQTQK